MGKSLTKKYLENQRKAEIDKEAKDLVLAHWADFCREADISILYTLHEAFGFGKERLERFYHEWQKTHIGMIKRYRCDNDNTHIWAMESQLKTLGVDVDALIAEKESEADDGFVL